VRRWVSIITAFSLAGCASKSADIAPAYVSPLTYQSFMCPQLTAEAQRVPATATRGGSPSCELSRHASQQNLTRSVIIGIPQ
jgi:hypothetical protein